MKALIFFLFVGLILFGCQKDSGTLVDAPVESRPAASQYTDDLAGSLHEVAQSLVQQRDWLSPSLLQIMRRKPVAISRLNLPVVARLEHDGRIYELALEACVKSRFGSDEPMRIAPWLEGHCADETSLTLYRWDADQNHVMIEQVETKVLEQGVSYPLVLLTLQDRTEMPLEPMRAGSKIFHEHESALAKASPSAGSEGFVVPYLALTKVRLHILHDGFSLEEFEMYVKEGDGAEDYFKPETIHLFNGVWRKDAAGQTVYYPDVNLHDTTYVFPKPIALWPLSNSIPLTITPLEDDCIAGEHRNWVYPNVYLKYTLEEYHHPSATRLANTTHGYLLVGPGCGFLGFRDNDDTYSRGTFSGWTASNTPEHEISIDLGDLEIGVKKIFVGTQPIRRELVVE